ncbi:RHS repeat domain-containing protein, partial [Akkermansia sp.]
LVSRSQSYDALGRPVTRTQQRGTEATRTDSFNYNGRNELTGATLGTEPYGYSYDNIGNRKTARELAEELTYAANNLNQYTSIEEKTEAPFVPTYDASGNQTLIKTSTGIWTVVYNAANRAVSFTSQGGSTVVECGYDYQGRRYMKKVTVNGTVASHERYLYRGYLQLAALDMLDNRNVLRTLLWDPLEPVATRPLALVQENALYCYGMDFNKNVTEVFAGEGAIAATYDYSPYGQVVSTGDLVQPVQWSSEMNDVELALVYYNYRYYNPADGRWINRDPITEEGGWNLYGFIENVVINKYDGLGLKKGFTKTGDPCPKCCKGCERSQERPVIKDAGTKGIDVKASVESPMFTSKCEHNGTCNENCCYVVYTWFDCYNKTCYSQTGDTFNRKVQPLRGVGRARSALGVSVQAYKWCSCNKGKWECHNVLLLSNTLLYQVDNPNNPKEWILIIPNKK